MRFRRWREVPDYDRGSAPRDPRTSVSPRVALAVAATVAFGIYALLAYGAYVPHFFNDELYYMEAGTSVARGDGLRFHGEEWGFGPLFPLWIAGLVRSTNTQEAAYELVKLANAALFALAVVPVYLLARRLLPAWPSVGVATLSLVIPSSMYVAVVMTESLAFVLAMWSMYAITRALERPTPARQLTAIAVVALAVLTRTQFVALLVAYVTSLIAVVAVSPTQRAYARAHRLGFWPTAGALLAGLAWLSLATGAEHRTEDALGDYAPLVRSYDLVDVGRLFLWHVGDIGLYVAVVPLVVAPVVLFGQWAAARHGATEDAAFLALFVSVNGIMLLLVAAFASTDNREGAALFDRYTFYVVPLWLIVLALWLHKGLPRPAGPIALGAVVAVVAVASMPFDELGAENWFRQFQAVSTEAWGKAGLVAERLPIVSLRTLGILFALTLVLAAVWLPRSRSVVFPTVVVFVFAANLSLAWRSAYVDPATFGSGPRGSRGWVDDVLGTSSHVTGIGVARLCSTAREGMSDVLTDFFNRSVDRGQRIGGEGPTLRITSDGTLTFWDGSPLAADYVVVPPGVELEGRRLASGMETGLVIWRVDGDVRVLNASSETELRRTPCTA